ncbi:MAG: hypothetical protein HUK25_04970, partial [Treponema sp.]|nr:hypothetical protein [Treponema sp.]
MMDSTDNTNELDSYGVWVKRQPASDENNLSPETEDPSSNFDIDSAFDIPDIEETIEETNSDSALNFDSVLDIPVETPENEALEESISEEISDEINLEDFEEINLDSNTSSESEESFTDVSDSEINEVNNTDTIEEVSDFELPSEDGEISLDDFLEDGFSDESVASGNNGLGETVEDGEISLDDFLDGGDFTSGPAETKEEEIVDEKPLEMDISFDNSIDSIETEENDQSDSVIFDDDEPPVQENIETEDVSNSFFEEHGSTEISSGSTEEIDLSDFGIDADAEETPITQDVEESKMRDSVIDYDLCVSDENLSSAPVVNEIKDKEPSKED